MRIHPVIRFIFGVLCAGLSALTVVEAPTSLLWLAALGVTEWGYWLAPLPLLTWLPGWNRSRTGQAGAWLGLAAALLLVTPLLRTAALVQSWPDQLPPFIRDAAPRSLDGASPRSAPVVLTDLLLGVSSPDVSKREVVYATNGGRPLGLDLYRTIGVTQAPGVIIVHGDPGSMETALNCLRSTGIWPRVGMWWRRSVTVLLRSGRSRLRGTTCARPFPS